MSLDATRWAWKQQGLRPLQKLILLSLADRAGPDSTVWPSYEQIEADTGADRKTVWTALKVFKAFGLIEDTGKRSGKTGQIVVFRLLGVEHREQGNRSKNGTVKEFQKRNCSEKGTVPFFPGNSSENGTSKQFRKRNMESTIIEPTIGTYKQSSSLCSEDCFTPSPFVSLRSTKGDPPNQRKEKNSPVPYTEIAKLFRESGLGRIAKLTDQRKKQLAARWLDGLPSLQHWREYFAMVRQTPFLLGHNRRGWRADFDWLINEGNAIKVIEGRYAGSPDDIPF